MFFYLVVSSEKEQYIRLFCTKEAKLWVAKTQGIFTKTQGIFTKTQGILTRIGIVFTEIWVIYSKVQNTFAKLGINLPKNQGKSSKNSGYGVRLHLLQCSHTEQKKAWLNKISRQNYHD